MLNEIIKSVDQMYNVSEKDVIVDITEALACAACSGSIKSRELAENMCGEEGEIMPEKAIAYLAARVYFEISEENRVVQRAAEDRCEEKEVREEFLPAV